MTTISASVRIDEDIWQKMKEVSVKKKKFVSEIIEELCMSFLKDEGA